MSEAVSLRVTMCDALWLRLALAAAALLLASVLGTSYAAAQGWGDET
jgi:hypothetical protein